MKSSLRFSSLACVLFASTSLVACDVVIDPPGSGTGDSSGAIQGSGATCEIDSDCPSSDEECDDNVCKLHGDDGTEDGAGGDDAAGHDAGDDNGVDAAGHDAGDDNGAGGEAGEAEDENEGPDPDDAPDA